MTTKINPAYELLGRLGNEPWLLAPTFTGVPASIRAMLAGAPITRDTLEDVNSRFGASPDDRPRPFAMVGQMAVIPVQGMLLNRFSGAWGYATGYDYIRMAYQAALADTGVKGIVFDVNSPGGDAQGCFEVCDVIRAGRKAKPSLAIVNANACSGAYAIASAAGSIAATPSARVGSIGVVTMHVDYSKALDESGIKVSFIFAGDHKVDGNPYEPLPKAVKDSIQARVDSLYAAFVGQVARNRGIEEKAVRKTEAAVYDAEGALEVGLIDRIQDASAAFAAFAEKLSPFQRENMQMTEKTAEAAAAEAAEKADAEKAAAEKADADKIAADAEKAAAPDAAAIVAAERERVSGILGCEEAKGRTALASHLALKTSMSVDDARAALSAAAAEKPADAKSPFLAAMAAGEHPDVGAGAGVASEPEQNSAAAILRDYGAATGCKPASIQ